jgi:hypothetical protein
MDTEPHSAPNRPAGQWLGSLLESLALADSEDYSTGMSAATIAKQFQAPFALHRVRGRPNVSVIRARPARPSRPKPAESRSLEMSEQDWEKFEKDIVDAFEQVP